MVHASMNARTMVAVADRDTSMAIYMPVPNWTRSWSLSTGGKNTEISSLSISMKMDHVATVRDSATSANAGKVYRSRNSVGDLVYVPSLEI